MKKTKIIATIGPASSRQNNIQKLINEGVNTFRINFSHGKLKTHQNTIKLIYKIAEEQNKIISILADLKGPKIRIDEIENDRCLLKTNNAITISNKKTIGNRKLISSSYKGLLDLQINDTILLDDGLIKLKVIQVNKENKEIKCEVIEGGVLKSKKGINIPYADINIPPFTKDDEKAANIAIEENIDYIALSFVKKAEDLLPLKTLIKSKNKNIPVIAKIERPAAIDNIDDIINEADGIMIARGDLGVEIPLEKVPLLQKEIILKTNRSAKPVITATQMLESMIDKPRATRAEVSDVANAILDGTDAVMLSGESAIGKYPIEAVRTMKNIALEIEKTSQTLYNRKHGMDQSPDNDTEEAIAIAACEMADNLNADTIAIYTNNHYSLALLSKFHPKCPIIAINTDIQTARKINLYWNVIPILINKKEKLNQTEMLQITRTKIKEISDKEKTTIILIDNIKNKMNSIRIFSR